MELRDYQRDALAAIASKFYRSVWSQILILPTGSGKTVVFAQLPTTLRDWLSMFPAGQRRILILAHREELLQQAARKLQQANPDLIVGVEQADSSAGPLCDVVIASIATLTARGGARLRLLDKDTFRVLVVDEAHHAAAETYQDVLAYFDVLPPTDLLPNAKAGDADHAAARARLHEWWQDNDPDRLLLGVTATPSRGDAIGLEWTFRTIVYERTLRWMIEQGHLAPLVGYHVETNLTLDRVKVQAGDFQTKALAEAVNTPQRNEQAVDAWRLRASDRSTLAFTVDIQHAKDLAAAFTAQGANADWVSGDDPLRDDKIRRFLAGDLQILTNCNLLTEGFDAPDVGCIVMARPTTSATLYMQMVGRGTRKAQFKENCVVLDVVDATKRHSLITAGDLFGLPARFDLAGDDAAQVAARIEAVMEQNPGLRIDQLRSMADIEKAVRQIDLWSVTESESVKRYAALSWVEAGPKRYHISLPSRGDNGAIVSGTQGGDRLELREDLLGEWTIVRVWRGGSEEVGMADTLPDAFKKAERWIQMFRPVAYDIKRQNQTWQRRPASRKQQELLRKFKATIDVSKLTRGEATRLIDQFLARKGAR